MNISSSSIFEILVQVFGELIPGLEFIYILLGGLLLIFVFHLIEHILELLFGKFFNR